MFFNLKFTISVVIMIGVVCLKSNGLELFPSELKNDVGDALEAIFSMGDKLETLLHTNSTEPRNFLISPLSLTLLLGQLMVGAEGKFQDHLYELVSLSKHKPTETPEELHMRLHLQLGRLLRLLEAKTNKERHFTLNSNNALFYNKNIDLKSNFVRDSKILYQTEFFPLNFGRAQDVIKTINNWAFDHTNGLIKNVMSTLPGGNTASIFANAIYFYGKWLQPFSYELNHPGSFATSKSTQVQVTYMVNFLEQVPFAESKRLNCKLLVLPYENNELGMYMVLPNVGHPDEYDISAFASKIKVADYLEMLGALKNHDVNVKVPKFSMTSSLSLLKPLQMYATYKKYMESRRVLRPGTKTTLKRPTNVLDELEDKKMMFELFQQSFNNVTAKSNTVIDDILLGAASNNGDLRVSDVVQHMTFAFNEVGTEAAAVSAGIVDYSGGAKSFLANKPFLFFIRHEATAATLFWGTISNPAS